MKAFAWIAFLGILVAGCGHIPPGKDSGANLNTEAENALYRGCRSDIENGDDPRCGNGSSSPNPSAVVPMPPYGGRNSPLTRESLENVCSGELNCLEGFVIERIEESAKKGGG